MGREGASAERTKQGVPVQSKEQNGSVSPLSGDELHLLQMINILQSPKEELMTFSWDPLKFWMFVRSFDLIRSFWTFSFDRLWPFCQ